MRITHGFFFLVLLLSGLAQAEETPIQAFTMQNGMRVLLSESHAIPMVKGTLFWRGGGVYDPIPGTAALTAAMLSEGGAGDLDPDAFNERLEFHGIYLSAEAGRDISEAGFTTLTEHLDETFARLGDLLLRPRFDPDSFKQLVERHIAGLIKEEEDPSTRASDALSLVIYGDHPYGQPISGTKESVKRITLNDLKKFHKKALRAPDMVLAVAGDITMARLRELLDTHLSGLDPRPSPFKPVPMAKSKPKGVVKWIKMDRPQTTFRFGLVGITRTDPDYYAAYVMNHILGGGDNSRLHEEIREKRGLTYGVFSYFAPWSGRGPFVIGMQTKTASATQARQLIRAELAKMVEEGVSDKELEEAKQYLTGSFPLRLDGLGKLTSNLVIMGYFDLGLDYLKQWPGRINAVTRQDVLRVARRMLDLRGLHEVAVGKKE